MCLYTFLIFVLFHPTFQIHWFSIFNSFMMVIFLVGLVSMILMRTLRKDYARYSKDEEMDDMVIVEIIFIFIFIYYMYYIWLGAWSGRRIWLETSSWWCIPFTTTYFAFLVFNWCWLSIDFGGFLCHYFRYCWWIIYRVS